jgi:hypothetical protein
MGIPQMGGPAGRLKAILDGEEKANRNTPELENR